MGLGAVLAVLLTFAALHLAWIAANVPRDELIVLIIAVCYGFYLIRHFFRLSYGLVEILIGLFAIFGAMSRSPQVVNDPTTGNLLLIQVAAGMYVVIRGFDNFAQSQPFAGGFAAFSAFWRFIKERWLRKPK
jgi:hypothetical protein